MIPGADPPAVPAGGTGTGFELDLGDVGSGKAGAAPPADPWADQFAPLAAPPLAHPDLDVVALIDEEDEPTPFTRPDPPRAAPPVAPAAPTPVFVVGLTHRGVPPEPWYHAVISAVACVEVAIGLVPLVWLLVAILVAVAEWSLPATEPKPLQAITAVVGLSLLGGVVAGTSALLCAFAGGVKLLAVDIVRNVRAQRYKV